MSELVGRTILNHYRIDAVIGRGGMGVVYKALDTRTNTTVAIKALPPELTHSPSLLRRFQQEAQALSSLHHPNIVRLIETFEENNTHFIVMEYVEGQTLSHILQKGPLPTEKAKTIALQICAALSHAHQQGIIHRDIKPSNIMITPDEKVKVTDFGIARVIDSTLGTITGTTMGTAEYMSPEQVRGEKADACSDIYSLGVVLYQMLTGRVPFTSDNRFAIGYMHLHQEPVPPRRVNPKVAEGLEEIVLHALEKRKEQRYQRVSDLAGDLQQELLSPQERARAKAVLKPTAEAIAKRKAVTRSLPQPKIGLRRLSLPVMIIAGVMLLLMVVIAGVNVVRAPSSGMPHAGGSEVSPTPPMATSAVEQPLATVAVAREEPPPVWVDTIAYIGSDGNIWLMEADGGEQERLTQDRRVTTFAWAPDGERIAFARRSDAGSRNYSDLVVVDLVDKREVVLLETNEYLISSVAWAPDGTHLVILAYGAAEYTRDVFQVDVSSGESTTLHSSPAYGIGQPFPFITSEVAWSPDGEFLLSYYPPTGDTKIFTMTNGEVVGTTEIETPCDGPRWSPDGSKITCHNFESILVVDPEGQLLQEYTMPEAGWQSPAWSPDGTRIATGGRTGLWVIDTLSQEKLQLVSREIWEPSWSPDGQQISFSLVQGLGSEVHELQGMGIVNADGTDLRELDQGSYLPAWQPMPSSLPGVASDTPRTIAQPTATSAQPQGRIAFESNRDGNREIYVMKADGTDQTRLTSNPGIDTVPCWSADGTYIVFFYERDGEWDGYVMNPDGSGQTRVISPYWRLCAQSWSPDRKLEAVALTQDGNRDIYVMNADGSGVTRLTNNPEVDQSPSWSPDGTRIAFESWRDGNNEIYVMNADGTGQMNLTHSPASDAEPSWSPDGTRIAFESDRDGNLDIYIMNADGTGVTRLTNNPARDGQPSWGP